MAPLLRATFARTRLALLAGLFAMGALLALPAATSAAPDTLTWTGGSSDDWSDPGNWDLARAPADGDTLVFGAAGTDTNNDITGLDVHALQFTASGDFVVGGKALGLGGGGVSVTGGSVTFDLPLELNADVEVSGPGQVIFRADAGPHLAVDLGGGTLSFRGGAEAVFNGDVAGIKTVDGPALAFHVPVSFHGTIENGAGGAAEVDFTHADDSAGCGSAAGAVVTGSAFTVMIDCHTALASLVLNASSIVLADAGASLTIAGVPAAMFQGTLSGPAGSQILCCATGGSLLLQGPTFGFSGTLGVTGAEVEVEDVHFGPDGVVSLSGGAVLRGAGDLGSLVASGSTLSPGAPGGGIGLMSFTDAWLGVHSTVELTFTETASDQLVVSGTLTLAEAALVLDLPFPQPKLQQSAALITGSGVIEGRFTNAAEGEVVSTGGLAFRVTYAGGASGRDFVATRVTPDPRPFKAYSPMAARD